MPRPDIVFRAALEDEESEDEIVVIPYVKPPPVVIDLLESESGNDSTQEDGSKRTPKKKSKKKKSRRDKEREQTGSTDVASLGYRTQESSMSPLTIDIDDEGQVSECRPDIDGVEEINCDQYDEPAASLEDANGSGNVAAYNTISSTVAPSAAPSIAAPFSVFNGVSGSSSHLEKCLDAQSDSTEANCGEKTETGMVMAGTPLAPKNKQKRVKSAERKSKGEGKSRKRTLSATQRTNEEIVTFLTTLGIQMEPTAFETPVTRRRQPRKRPTQPQLPIDVTGENSLDSSATHSNDGQNFPAPLNETTTPSAYVAVSQDFNSPSKRDSLTPKGKRQRKAISGDLSDYTISFTNKDLNAINTNFQSNVVIAETNNRKQNVEDSFITVASEKNKQKSSGNTKQKSDYYADVIDAVARGLDSSPSPTLTSSMEPEKIVPISESNEVAASSMNIQTDTETDICVASSSNSVTENHRDREETEPNKQVSTQAGHNVDLLSRPLTVSASDTENSPVDQRVEETENLGTNEKISSVGDGTSTLDESCITNISTVPSTIVNSEETHNSKTTKKKTSSVADAENVSNELLKSVPAPDRDNRNKRKYRDMELLEETTGNASSKESQLGVRGKENSRFSRKSPERKRHRSNYEKISTTSGSPDAGSALQVQSGASPKILTPSCRVVQNDIATTPCHVTNESYFPTTWSDHMKDFYGSSSNENFELDEVWPSLPDSSHLWKAYKDMMPPPRNKKRHVRCDRCKQLGHLIKECKEKWKPPTCHYCGKVGHTSDNHSRHSRTCPSAMCLNCGRRSSRYAQKCHRCLLQSRPSRCEICNVPGHDRLICPDNWRRYHSVISPVAYEKAEALLSTKPDWNAETDRRTGSKNAKVYKRSSSMYCANCGRRGHSYYECNGSKFNPYPRNKPFIIREPLTHEAAVSSSSSASSTCIPISYDSRTGRTVLMNAEANEPELTVETIQVKITNDLALQTEESQDFQVVIENDLPVSYSTPRTNKRVDTTVAEKSGNGHYLHTACENIMCANKLRSDEQCYQIMMETKAHLKLLGDQQRGALKLVEQKHQTQVSVIDDGCSIHICGLNALDADKDLHLLLRGHPIHRSCTTPSKRTVSGISQKITSKTCTSGRHSLSTSEVKKTGSDNRIAPSGGRLVEVVTVDDEENDCCVIIEPENSVSKKKHVSGVSTSENSTRREAQSSRKTFFMDHSPSQVHVELDPPAPENIKEAKSKANSESEEEEETQCNTPASKSAWSDYVSPLTGLSIGCSANVSATNEKENQKTSTETYRDLGSNYQSMLPSSAEGKNYATLNQPSLTGFGTFLAASTHSTDQSRNTTVGTIDDSSEFFEFEEIDYANGEHLATVAQNIVVEESQSDNSSEDSDSSNSDPDLIVLDPAPVVEKNVEIITIEDDDEQVQNEAPTPIKQTPLKQNEETVCLLPSEWDLAITEVVRKNNVINQISEEFQVDIEVSKEMSSIIIRNGAGHTRKMAKDEIVCWLESRCLNTEYHLTRRRGNNHLNNNNNELKLKIKRKPKPRALKLHDVQQHSLTGDFRSNKKRKKKFKRNNNADNNSSNTPTSSSSSFQSSNSNPTSPIRHQLTFKKRKTSKSGATTFNSRNRLHSPSPKKMQHHNGPRNNSDDSFPIASSKAYFPRKTRYFQS